MPSQLFATKSLKVLLEEMAGEHRLKRVLGPITLTALGIGAVIGAGIFVATGEAANEKAGPALMVSYVVAGITCIFAALCYAEFASMAPVAGSAYTYAYTTLGELFAWIIGWDLVLEYAVGAATVANGWSSYFRPLLEKVGIVLPMMFSGAPYEYHEGHLIDNVKAQYARENVAPSILKDEAILKNEAAGSDAKGPFTAKQRVMKGWKWGTEDGKKKKEDVKFRWAADGESRPAGTTITAIEEYPVYWVFTLKKQEKDKDNPHETVMVEETIVIGKVGEADVESKIVNRQRAYFNLMAILVTILITAVLVKGISESAGFNAIMVVIKVLAVLFVIVVGAFYVKTVNWTGTGLDDKGFAPFGWTGISFFGIPIMGETNDAGQPVGVLAGAAIIFFAYIGFDSVSTHAEEAKNPKRDVPIGIIASLVICTILYIAVVAVLTGMVRFNKIDTGAGVSKAFGSKEVGLGWAEVIINLAGVAGITSVLLVMMLSAPRVFLAMARDGLVPTKFFADIHPRFQTPWKSTIAIGVFVCLLTGFLPIGALLDLTNIGTLFAFVIVCTAVLIMRRTNPDAARPFRCPMVPAVPILGIASCLLLMMSLPKENWLRLFAWLGLGLIIYFSYGKRHSHLGKELRGEINSHGVSPAGMIDPGNKLT